MLEGERNLFRRGTWVATWLHQSLLGLGSGRNGLVSSSTYTAEQIFSLYCMQIQSAHSTAVYTCSHHKEQIFNTSLQETV